MKRDTWRSWPRQVYSDRWRFEGSSRAGVATSRASIISSSGACERVRAYARSTCICVLLVEMILGSRGGPALRVLDDVFLSRKNRNFYAARLGISPERAAPPTDKPLEGIYNRHPFGKGDFYPSGTLPLLHEMYVSGWNARTAATFSKNADNNTCVFGLLVFSRKVR